MPGSANACYPVCAALDWCVCVAAHMMLAVSILLELQLWLCRSTCKPAIWQNIIVCWLGIMLRPYPTSPVFNTREKSRARGSLNMSTDCNSMHTCIRAVALWRARVIHCHSTNNRLCFVAQRILCCILYGVWSGGHCSRLNNGPICMHSTLTLIVPLHLD